MLRGAASTEIERAAVATSDGFWESTTCAVKLAIPTSNLGDTRTLVIPVSHTIFFEMGPERRASMGIADSLIRVSVGIEDQEDLIGDFAQALEKQATRAAA